MATAKASSTCRKAPERRKLWLLLISWLCAFGVAAQTGAIRLQVFGPSGENFAGDSITLHLRGPITRSFLLSSDSLKGFYMRDLPYGDYGIALSSKNYYSDAIWPRVTHSKPVEAFCILRPVLVKIEVVKWDSRFPVEMKPLSRRKKTRTPPEPDAPDSITGYASKQTLLAVEQLKEGITIPDSTRVNQLTSMQSWSDLFARTLVYPLRARVFHAEGRVYLSFTTDHQGCINSIRLLRSLDPYLALEAARVLRMAAGFYRHRYEEWETPS